MVVWSAGRLSLCWRTRRASTYHTRGWCGCCNVVQTAAEQKGRLAPAVGSSDPATDKAADGLDIMTQMDGHLVPSVELDETSEIFW
jgi:hypothetical protein